MCQFVQVSSKSHSRVHLPLTDSQLPMNQINQVCSFIWEFSVVEECKCLTLLQSQEVCSVTLPAHRSSQCAAHEPTLSSSGGSPWVAGRWDVGAPSCLIAIATLHQRFISSLWKTLTTAQDCLPSGDRSPGIQWQVTHPAICATAFTSGVSAASRGSPEP